MKNKKQLYLLISFIFLCKLVLAYSLPLFADEAYYYIWSLKPQLSYFDHPGMVSWLIYLSRFFRIVEFSLGLRLFFIILSLASMFIWIEILSLKKATLKQITTFIVLASINPLLGPGSVIATPDAPLVFFWSLSYYYFYKLFEADEPVHAKHPQNWKSYLLLGCSLGLGFCSKYHIVLFVFSGLTYLVISKKLKLISLKGVLLTLFSGFIFSLPVLVWNYQNEWASFLFQLKHGFGKQHYDWMWTLNFYIAQIFLISPYVFFNVFKQIKNSVDAIFSLTQLMFFTTSSFKAIVEANWPITSILHFNFHFIKQFEHKKLNRTYQYWLVIYILLVVFMTTSYSNKALRNQYRSTQLDNMMSIVEKYQPLYGSSYQVSSLLSWKSGVLIPKLRGLSRFDFFDTMPESIPTDKKIFVLKHFDSIWPNEYNRYVKTKLDTFSDLKVDLYELVYQ